MKCELMQFGIYAIAFSHPIVATNTSRIRMQISAAHDREQLDKSITAFKTARNNLQTK